MQGTVVGTLGCRPRRVNRRFGVPIGVLGSAAVVAASLLAPPPAVAAPAASAAPAGSTEPCQVTVPPRVVLRAVTETVPYSVGAAWGACPAWVRQSGYHSFSPPEERGVQWIFSLVSKRPVAPAYSGYLWLTAYRGGTPRVNAFRGLDYFPLAPGTYALDRALTSSTQDGLSPFYSNLSGIELTASNGFVARYWSGVRVGVVRTGQRTTVTVVGRRDRIQLVQGGAIPQAAAPASGARVELRRDGRRIGTLTLDRSGVGRVTFVDQPGRHTYAVTLPGTATNWPATASTRT